MIGTEDEEVLETKEEEYLHNLAEKSKLFKIDIDQEEDVKESQLFAG